MTKEEARKFLANSKIYVGRHSKELQEKLFEIGFRWNDGKKTQNTDKPFLFTGVTLITCGNDVEYFNDKIEAVEIDPINILDMTIDEEPRFKPFERVLFKMGADNDYWRAGLYSHMCGSFHYIVGYGYVSEGDVIPYDGNEDKLGKVTD